MRRLAYIFLIPLFVIGGNVNAQFAKPLPQKQDSWAEAQFSVGIIGGVSATRWLHQGGANTVFEQPLTTIALDSTFLTTALNNALVGITVQKKLGDYHAVGLDVIYANRNTELSNKYISSYSFDHHSIKIRDHSNIQYSELLFQIPITQYLTSSTKAIRPYIFIAPRVTIPLQGGIDLEKDSLVNGSPMFFQNNTGTNPQSVQTPKITDTLSARNMRRWNIGAVVGLGIQFRIPVGSYYFDTKLDASCHLGLLNTYSKYERGLVTKKDSKGNDILDPNGNPVLDLPINLNTGSPIDPSLIGKRYISNATVKLTLLFPIKKIQKDACFNWGEYD